MILFCHYTLAFLLLFIYYSLEVIKTMKTEKNNDTDIKLMGKRLKIYTEVVEQNYIEQENQELKKENKFMKMCREFWKTISNFFGLIIAVFFRIVSKIIFIASGILTVLGGIDLIGLKLMHDEDTHDMTVVFLIVLAIFFASAVINTISKLYIRDTDVK